jgi:nucleoside-triphosphatase THEP1
MTTLVVLKPGAGLFHFIIAIHTEYPTMEPTGFEPSNHFLDDDLLPTWSDLSCQPDEGFSNYLQREFGNDHWVMHSPYLTNTFEEHALITTIVSSLGDSDMPLYRRDGALFDYDNKRRTGYIVQSQMGTGKTTFLQHIVERINEVEKETGKTYRVLFFTNRVSLATAQMEILKKLGVVCYKDVEGQNEIPNVMKLVVSMESVPRLQDRAHNMEMPMADLIIWDEFTTGALHATSDTIRCKEILLNYIYEVASYGRTTFVYSDAYFCPDGIDIIRNIHCLRDSETKATIERDRVFYLLNAFRPARPGLLNFHVQESNFTMAMREKIDECIGRWEDEIARSLDEQRDPIFNDQLVCCFMSKAQLKNYVNMLKTTYPSVFSDRYIVLIHSDCDASAVRTTHAATTEWPKVLAIFHTSSVLVGTNYNVRERSDVIASRKRARPVEGRDEEKAILDRIKIDVFCHGISEHPCAISLAQMMARTRYNGRNGMVHFLVPMDSKNPQAFPTDKETLMIQLDETRCYMNDQRLTGVSGSIKSTVVFNERTGERKVAMALQHNAPYTQFYIYRMLCANRSKVSFLGHLKSIMNGFSESVNARRLEDLAPVFLQRRLIRRRRHRAQQHEEQTGKL